MLGRDRLASDPRTQVYVNLMANYQELFYSHFITATIRLGITGLKPGTRERSGKIVDHLIIITVFTLLPTSRPCMGLFYNFGIKSYNINDSK